MKEEKVFFKNSEGLKICGILEKNEVKNARKKKQVVIIVHGYSSSKDRSSAKGMAEELSKRKIDSFRIDLDGCGESEGEFGKQTITSAVDDILSAIKLVKKKGFKDMMLFGSSAGGLAVMATALKIKKIKRIGLAAPVSDYITQKRMKYGILSMLFWKLRGWSYYTNRNGKKLKVYYSFIRDIKDYTMYDKVKAIKCPVLIVHGDADESVDVEQSIRVAKGFPDAKLVVLKGGDHALGVAGDRADAIRLFGDWFEKGIVKNG